MKLNILLIICLIFPVISFSQNGEDAKGSANKKHSPKYALFYDNHVMPPNPDVGKDFDVEDFTDRLVKAGVDYLTVHARSNQGMTFYDTKIGIKYPPLKYDLFGKIADACKRKGIALTAYMNGGLSHEEGLRHRDWLIIEPDGRVYREPRVTAWVRQMCFNTPYREHTISLIEEVAKNYPVAGFFIDGVNARPCVCPACVRGMKEKNMDVNNIDDIREFARLSSLSFAQDIAKAARAINPNFLLYFNGISYKDQVEFGAYLELEYIPTSGGYDAFPVFEAYMRTLGDMPVLLMNTRFNNWRHFGGLRTEAAIKAELLSGLANGMRPNVGGHFHPRYGPFDPALDRIGKIYNELQTMEPWFSEAKNLADIAVVFKGENVRGDRKLNAAVRMLGELKQQFDVASITSDWSKYKVLVIPDDVPFDEEFTKRVKAHIDAGKAIIASGSSGLDPEGSEFVFEKEWGVKYLNENDFNPAFFAVRNNFNKDLPDMPIQLFSTGINVKPLAGTRVEADLVKPYYNNIWDGEYAYEYCPPDKVTEFPALTINGNIAHFSHRIFAGYYAQAHVELRNIFRNVLQELLPQPLFKYENLPSFARVYVTEQPGRRMVHVLSYVPEKRGAVAEMIEEPIILNNIKLSLQTDGKTPKKVYIAPEMKPLRYKINNGYIDVTIPESKGHSLIVFEH
ncbi:MAG: hypothetical protein GX126_03285 [Bacteroidales bacterium]|jgi:hypothetical protein|nr:hypothetical protein [Bacteroidales bacterium]